MREIKFRSFEDNEMNYKGFSIDRAIDLHNGGQLILMQYTGLEDRNGIEIYEGDIVSCCGRRRIIKWSNGKYWFHSDFGNTYEDISEMFCRYHLSVEVLGNIYQHPELIGLTKE